MLKKRKLLAGLMTVLVITTLFAGCGKKQQEDFRLEGSCSDILNRVYAAAKLDDEMRAALDNYVAVEMQKENEEYILGTTGIEYTDSIVSTPLMNVIPYQCVLLRIGDINDIDGIKQTLADNADLRKWVCVEAESMMIESVGDVILFVMADQQTAEALRDAFLALQ